MKGKLHKSVNYGWMVQDEHCGIDNMSFYPLHPYDVFTCGIERVEGKEVDFILQDFWDVGLEEKMIKVAIINANIGQVEMTQVVFNENTGEVRFTPKDYGVNGDNSYKQSAPIEWLKQVYKVTGTLSESDFEYADQIIQSLKQPK